MKASLLWLMQQGGGSSVIYYPAQAKLKLGLKYSAKLPSTVSTNKYSQ